MENENAFTVYIYANEYEYLKWLVQQKQYIETGGDLFGAWQDELSAVVQFVLGPGKKCRRTSSSFFQDTDYLQNVGDYLTSTEGICNIGEWHSHHRLGLAYPSTGDQNTVWRHMPECGRFLVFIANIQSLGNVSAGCFMFDNATREMKQGRMKVLMNCSPIRHAFEQKRQFQSKSENGHDWITFCSSKTTTSLWGRSDPSDALENGEIQCICDEMKLEKRAGCWDVIQRIVCYESYVFSGLCRSCCCAGLSALCYCCRLAIELCFSAVFWFIHRCRKLKF